MKTRSIQILTAMAVVAASARTASAADQSGAWSLSILGGDSVAESGSLRSPASATITDLGVLDPTLAGSSGTLSLDKLKYEDLFKRRFDTGLELDYSFTDNLQSYGRFGYASLDGRTRSIGELTGGSISEPTSVTARFGDQDNMSFELGSRYYWSTGSSWRPFAGLALGATHMDGIHASLATPVADPDLQNLHFTRAGTMFSQSVETGVEYNPTNEFGVRLSLDASHIGARPAPTTLDSVHWDSMQATMRTAAGRSPLRLRRTIASEPSDLNRSKAGRACVIRAGQGRSARSCRGCHRRSPPRIGLNLWRTHMDHRWGMRVAVDIGVQLFCPPRTIGVGRLVDVSMSGALVRSGFIPPLFARVRVAGTLGELQGRSGTR
ncbi:MAG: hypothetical protein WDO56_06765 [Gammaproteobacteria bacterium]